MGTHTDLSAVWVLDVTRNREANVCHPWWGCLPSDLRDHPQSSEWKVYLSAVLQDLSSAHVVQCVKKISDLVSFSPSSILPIERSLVRPRLLVLEETENRILFETFK